VVKKWRGWGDLELMFITSCKVGKMRKYPTGYYDHKKL
jgi:hypothetical protein